MAESIGTVGIEVSSKRRAILEWFQSDRGFWLL